MTDRRMTPSVIAAVLQGCADYHNGSGEHQAQAREAIAALREMEGEAPLVPMETPGEFLIACTGLSLDCPGGNHFHNMARSAAPPATGEGGHDHEGTLASIADVINQELRENEGFAHQVEDYTNLSQMVSGVRWIADLIRLRCERTHEPIAPPSPQRQEVDGYQFISVNGHRHPAGPEVLMDDVCLCSACRTAVAGWLDKRAEEGVSDPDSNRVRAIILRGAAIAWRARQRKGEDA